jgi:hypothetical protein
MLTYSTEDVRLATYDGSAWVFDSDIDPYFSEINNIEFKNFLTPRHYSNATLTKSAGENILSDSGGIWHEFDLVYYCKSEAERLAAQSIVNISNNFTSSTDYFRLYPNYTDEPLNFYDVHLSSHNMSQFHTDNMEALELSFESIEKKLFIKDSRTSLITDAFNTAFYEHDNWTKSVNGNEDENPTTKIVGWEFDSNTHYAEFSLNSYLSANTSYLIAFREFYQPAMTSDISVIFLSGATELKNTSMTSDNNLQFYKVDFGTGDRKIRIEQNSATDYTFAGIRNLRIWSIE